MQATHIFLVPKLAQPGCKAFLVPDTVSQTTLFLKYPQPDPEMMQDTSITLIHSAFLPSLMTLLVLFASFSYLLSRNQRPCLPHCPLRCVQAGSIWLACSLMTLQSPKLTCCPHCPPHNGLAWPGACVAQPLSDTHPAALLCWGPAHTLAHISTLLPQIGTYWAHIKHTSST